MDEANKAEKSVLTLASEASADAPDPMLGNLLALIGKIQRTLYRPDGELLTLDEFLRELSYLIY